MIEYYSVLFGTSRVVVLLWVKYALPGGGREGVFHLKVAGMLVVSLRE